MFYYTRKRIAEWKYFISINPPACHGIHGFIVMQKLIYGYMLAKSNIHSVHIASVKRSRCTKYPLKKINKINAAINAVPVFAKGVLLKYQTTNASAYNANENGRISGRISGYY